MLLMPLFEIFISGEYEKLFEAYMEYADISIINSNIPQAIRLLFEVETFVEVYIYNYSVPF